MKCFEFEKLFIKESQDELLEHIQICEDCMSEYKKMEVTEKIIKEAKPYFRQKKHTQHFALKAVASFALLVVSSSVLFHNNINTVFVTKIAYDDSVSASFPVDEYGLLDIQ